MIVAVPRETHPGERRVALVPASVPPWSRRASRSSSRPEPVRRPNSRPTVYREGGQDRPVAPRCLCRRHCAASPRRRGQTRSGPRRPGTLPPGPSGDRLVRSAGLPPVGSRDGHTRRLSVRPGVAAPHHPGPEHGRPLVAGHRGGLSGGADGRRSVAQDVPHDDHGCRHDQRREGFCDRGGRGRPASHRHGPAARRRHFRLQRRPAVKEQVQSLGAKFVEMELETGRPRRRGATPSKWTRSSIAVSAS